MAGGLRQLEGGVLNLGALPTSDDGPTALAILAAIRRASSLVSSLAADSLARHQLSGLVRQGESVGKHAVLYEIPLPAPYAPAL